MITEFDAVRDYEQVLTGNGQKKKVGDKNEKIGFQLLFKNTRYESRKELVVIIRYAVEKILRWPPEDFAANVNTELLHILKLDEALSEANGGKKKKDDGLDKSYNIPTILKEAFPEAFAQSEEDVVLRMYKRVAKIGEYENDPEERSYPRGFFNNEDGVRRLRTIVRYLDSNYLSGFTIYEKYAFFADKVNARRWFKHMGLSLALTVVDPEPLELYHSAFHFDNGNNLFYFNEKLKQEYQKMKRRR